MHTASEASEYVFIMEKSGDSSDATLSSRIDSAPSSDHILAYVVSLSNDAGLELGLRVFAGGTILSGTLIGGSKFFAALSETINPNSQGDDSVAGAMSKLFESLSDQYKSPDLSGDAVTTYLHLKNAWSFVPGQDPLLIGLWRGRLSQIDGWSVGVYGNVDE